MDYDTFYFKVYGLVSAIKTSFFLNAINVSLVVILPEANMFPEMFVMN